MNRKLLLDALLSVKSGVANKDIVESMTYFYFSGEHVVTYNDVISIRHPLKTSFTAFVKADDFIKIISKIKSESIELELNDAILNLKADKVRTSFPTLYDQDIIGRVDSVSKSVKALKFTKLPTDFMDAMSLCHPVASKNESDQMLICIYINGKDVISTDNIRIAHYTMDSPMPGPIMVKSNEIKSLIGISPIEFSFDDTWIHFLNESGCTFSIRRVKGDYPNMLKFSEFTGTRVNLPKELLDGLDLASVFTEDSNDSVNIAIKNGICRVFKEGDSGKLDFREKVTYKGEPISFYINPTLLKDMMKHSTEIVVTTGKAKLSTKSFELVTALQES